MTDTLEPELIHCPCGSEFQPCDGIGGNKCLQCGRTFDLHDPEDDEKWIAMADRKPNVRDHAIGFDAFYGRVGEIEHSYAEKWGFVDSQGDDCSITHWRPMPAPPSETKEG